LVIESGDANAEVTDAHVSGVKNKTFSTLRNRLEEIEKVIDFNATNEVENGDFSEGTTGWEHNGSYGEISATDNTLIATGLGTGTSLQVIQPYGSLPSNVPSGTKYYIVGKIKAPSTATNIFLNYRDISAEMDLGVSQKEPSDEYVTLSGIITLTTTSVNPFVQTIVTFPDEDTQNGAVVEYKHFMAINLTKTFRSGYEPTKKEFEAFYLSYFSNNWFDGMESLGENRFLSRKVKEVENELTNEFGNNIANSPLFKYGVKDLLNPKWERGGISGVTGEKSGGNNRFRTVDVINFNEKAEVTSLNSNYKFSVFTYQNNTFVNETGWVTSLVSLPYDSEKSYHIVVGRIDDNSMSDGEILNIDQILRISIGEFRIDEQILNENLKEKINTTSLDILGVGKKYVGITGKMGNAPSNTIEAIKMSKLAGAWGVEFDLRLTADNNLVLRHDADLTSWTTETEGKLVREYTTDEIKAFDITSRASLYEQPLKIPTIDEALSICHEFNLVPFLDIKDDESELVIDIISEKLSKLNMLHQAVVIESDKSALEYARNKMPNTWLSVKSNIDSTVAEDEIEIAKSVGGNIVIQPEFGSSPELLTEERVEKYHKAGYAVRDVDFIFTFDPVNEFRPSTKYWVTLKTSDAGDTWSVLNTSPNQEVTLNTSLGLGYDAIGISFSDLDWNCMQELKPSVFVGDNIIPTLDIKAGISDSSLKQLLVTFNYNNETGSFGQLPIDFSFVVNVNF